MNQTPHRESVQPVERLMGREASARGALPLVAGDAGGVFSLLQREEEGR